jgi:hypothetical protein
VIKRIGKSTYHVELLAGLQVHNVFHVSMLCEHQEIDSLNTQDRFETRFANEDD